MVNVNVGALSAPIVPREPFQRDVTAGVERAVAGVFQGVSDIKAGRTLREFEGAVGDVEQQRVAFDTRLGEINADLESTEDKVKTQALFDEVSRLDRGLEQGKLSRSAAQTRLRSLFSQFASDHPSLVPEFQQVIGLSRIGGTGGLGASRSATSLSDQDPVLAATREADEEAFALAIELGVSVPQARANIRTAGEQKITLALGQQAANNGALRLQEFTSIADAAGGNASLDFYNQLLQDVKNPLFDVEEKRGELELLRAQTLSGFTQMMSANTQASQDSGDPFVLTVAQQDELQETIDGHFDIMNTVLASKDPVAAMGRVTEAVKTRSARNVTDAISGFVSGLPRDILISMSDEDKLTTLFVTAPRAAAALEKGQVVFDQLAQEDPSLLVGAAIVKSFPSTDVYNAKLGGLLMSNSKGSLFPDGEVTADMVQREGPDAVVASTYLSAKWEGTDLPKILVDSGEHVMNSHFVSNLENLLDPRAIETFKQFPEGLLAPVESMRVVRLANTLTETIGLLDILPAGFSVEVDTAALAQPVQAKGADKFKAGEFLVLTGEISSEKRREIDQSFAFGSDSVRAQERRTQKKLDVINTLLAFRSQFVTSDELVKEVNELMDNLELADAGS